jgi:hypothetical protein
MGTDEEGGPLSFVTPNEMVVTPDVIVLRPVREWTQEWTDQAQANGQIVIADLDDDLWAHENYEELQITKPDTLNDWFWNVDGVLASTRYLAKKIVDRGQKAPVVYAPNCYDPFGLDADPSPGRVIGTRLWLSGRMNDDLVMYDELVRPLLEELDLTFLHLGAEPGHSFLERGWDSSRLIERASVPIPLFPQALADLSVGIICMSEHPYNLAKTETHAVELASMGVPLVAVSNHSLYENVPGRIDADYRKIRNRVKNLRHPLYFRNESVTAKAWARRVAARNEIQYLSGLTQLVDVLRSR